MGVVSQVREDFREKTNLDIYVTVVTAVAVSVLSILDVLPASKTSSIILAVLAILAFNTLATRTAVERRNAGEATLERFTDYFPDELIPARESSGDTLLIGVALSRTIQQSYGAFERNLRQGAKIRLVLTDPDAGYVALDARHHFSRPETAELRHEVRASLRKLERLRRDTGGDIQVRTTKIALTFGLNYLDTGRSTAALYVQLYGYRLRGESRPMFRITRRDGHWFDCYADQAEALWRDSEDFDFDRLREPNA